MGLLVHSEATQNSSLHHHSLHRFSQQIMACRVMVQYTWKHIKGHRMENRKYYLQTTPIDNPVHFHWFGIKSKWTLYMYRRVHVRMRLISGSLSPWHSVSSGCGWRNGPQIWRVAVNTLNKQSWTAEKGWSSSFRVGRGANNSSP
jgi:hypothetical protein